MSKFKKEQKSNGVIKLKKTYEKLTEENKQKADELDYITKMEIIEAIKKIAKELDIKVNFTLGNKQNKLK